VTILLWLGPPLVVTVVAWVVVLLSHRPRPPLTTDESIAERERFRRAMERGLPRRRPRPRARKPPRA
jgi:cytochrome c-type biogenesis protein CcmH/NrfF